MAFHEEPKILSRLGETQANDRWSQLLNVHSTASVRFVVKPGLLESLALRNGHVNPAYAFEPLWMDVTAIAGGITLADRPAIALTLGANDTEKVSDTIMAAKQLSGNYVESLQRYFGSLAGPSPREKERTNTLIDLARQLVNNVVVTSAGNRVLVHSHVSNEAYEIAASILPDLIAANQVARFKQASNNMQHILLAMLNFESAYKRLPTSVMVDRKSGETHSWRVAILPYIEQAELYNRYRFDQPWDSPANLEVMKEMPAIFADAGVAGTQETPYQILQSEGGALNPTRPGIGPRFGNFVDGTSNTAMLIKAKPLVPWTQPVDYQAPDKLPLDDIAGDSESGLLIGMADGSVRYLTEAITAEVWQALLTRAGGERVALP